MRWYHYTKLNPRVDDLLHSTGETRNVTGRYRLVLKIATRVLLYVHLVCTSPPGCRRNIEEFFQVTWRIFGKYWTIAAIPATTEITKMHILLSANPVVRKLWSRKKGSQSLTTKPPSYSTGPLRETWSNFKRFFRRAPGLGNSSPILAQVARPLTQSSKKDASWE